MKIGNFFFVKIELYAMRIVHDEWLKVAVFVQLLWFNGENYTFFEEIISVVGN